MNQETVRTELVRLILALRADYLRSGANVLAHWEQLHTRLRAAAMRSATIPEFVTAYIRSLAVTNPSKDFCSASSRLEAAVDQSPCDAMRLIDKEHAYIIALARQASEAAKERMA